MKPPELLRDLAVHPLQDLAGPLGGLFLLVMAMGLLVVFAGWYQHWSQKDREWSIQWERVLVALIEMTAVLIIAWKVDQWVRILARTEGAQ